jgi:hypothetical protein
MKYAKVNNNNGRLKSIEIYEGESIETKCARILQNKEPITDTAPIIYTAKEDGVLPAYNIRTDRFDIAIDAYDKITRSSAKKEQAVKPEDFGNVPEKTQGGSPSEN